LQEGHQILKFVPASGAASRMFKNLFEYLSSQEDTPFISQFFRDIHQFAFFESLNEVCLRNEGKDIDELIAQGQRVDVVKNLLTAGGLNYGNLPKGLLLFHSYTSGARTPALEHLVEGAMYANDGKAVNLHFTVSHEHLELFRQHIHQHVADYQEKYGVLFNVSFSEQKPSTDTIAANPDGTPFRNADGTLLFRPGGHGALIENLNDCDADIIFVKNIDNVVPDRLKEPTVRYKQMLAGLLVSLQKQTFAYLAELEHEDISDAKLQVIRQFCEQRLCNHFDGYDQLTHDQQVDYLRRKLNRPMRVCGMVKNEGEPGGGPFITRNADGSYSPQILESSQIADKTLMAQATHFNPVDLVCATRDYQGHKFDLPKHVDPQTGFISNKSKDGRELLALELPGLWNGAMSDWNTIFVEVPVSTFNPVKTVNDLLREQHQ
ncbi:MAG: DUF4301 family protein, partial [Paludibacteraceae bacterium]|nr:DUF4301 family protein [Paludibacteraceae bacterium]